MLGLKALKGFVKNYPWIHTWIGIGGNACFFAGSIMFLFKGDIETAGVWLFIIGSGGMLIGSLGQAICDKAKERPDIRAELGSEP